MDDADKTSGEQPLARETLRHDGTHWLVSPQGGNPPRQPGPGLVPALDKAIAVIEYLNAHEVGKVSLAELASNLQITKSHCHSILKTLLAYDWLRFDDLSKTYELHSGIFGSISRLLGTPAIDIIRREVGVFVEKVRFPCVLSQPLADDSFMLVDKFHDPMRMEVSLPMGYRYPRDACAQMRAYLGWATRERIADWMKAWTPTPYTKLTPVTASEVITKIAETRIKGYAVSRGEFTEGLMAIAVPIFDRDRRVEYILNCSAPVAVLDGVEAEVASEIRATVDRIHRQTLARPPEDF